MKHQQRNLRIGTNPYPGVVVYRGSGKYSGLNRCRLHCQTSAITKTDSHCDVMRRRWCQRIMDRRMHQARAEGNFKLMDYWLTKDCREE